MPTESMTLLLERAARADTDAIDEIFDQVHRELRSIARVQLRRERAGHTLTPTALVNEAYVKLVAHAPDRLENRSHFLSIAARAMRQVLVTHAEKRATSKRGAELRRVTFVDPAAGDDSPETVVARCEELVALDRALSRLETFDPRLAKVVEYRFFAGMSVQETAALLEVSDRTVKRDWRAARAWLRGALDGDGAPDDRGSGE